MRKLAALFIVLTFLLTSCGFAGNQSRAKRLTIHEWGVIDAEAAKTLSEGNKWGSSLVSGMPLFRLAFISEPVIYCYSNKTQTFNLSISIDSLKDDKGYTAIYPSATQVGKTIKWKNVKVGTSKAIGPFKFPREMDGINNAWVEYASDMAAAQANKIEYKGRSYPYLFYEAEAKFQSRVRFIGENGDYFVRNESAFNVYDLYIASIRGFYYQAVLKPGKHKIDFQKRKHGPGINLQKLGFFPKEEAAFKSIWQGKFFDFGRQVIGCALEDDRSEAERKSDDEVTRNDASKDYKLTYRLPRTEYDRLSRIKIKPKPYRLLRALYVYDSGYFSPAYGFK